MCRAALLSLAAGGHCAVAVVRPELADDPQLRSLAGDALQLRTVTEEADGAKGADGRPLWREVYGSCDATLVVAPESDGILQRTLAWCRKHGIRTCNAEGSFLERAADKLATAYHLALSGLPHPPTRLLARVDQRWLRQTAAALPSEVSKPHAEQQHWVLKQRGGVGCERMQRVTAQQLSQLSRRRRGGRSLAGRDWIVQPWIAGASYSRSAIFDDRGRPHWLPVARQHLVVDDRVRYCGGSILPDMAAQLPGLEDLLKRAARALGPEPRGWVGFDFLVGPEPESPVTIIEVNPRLTTSFVGLCAAGDPALAAAIVAACCGEAVRLPTQWRPVAFTPESAAVAS